MSSPSAATLPVEFDATDEIMEIQMGPSHPASHGTIKFNLKLDGERVINCDVEVGYLLQRMESYAGLAILTTNLKSALDTAFMRRIRFVVEFPFPDHADRARIWERAFPSATPTAGLDVARLAQLSVAGGGIKNVALGAAFLAAEVREPVGMAHVLRAARADYAKLARPLTDAEVAGWA